MSIVTIVTDRPKYARISTFNDRLLECKSQNDRLNTLDNVDMFKNRFFVKYITIYVVLELKLNQYAKYTRTNMTINNHTNLRGVEWSSRMEILLIPGTNNDENKCAQIIVNNWLSLIV